MRSRRKTATSTPRDAPRSGGHSYSSMGQQEQRHCYEGERLVSLLKSMERAIESSKQLDTGRIIPEKIWLKQQFAVGVNEVTRSLERMPSISEPGCSSLTSSVKLQAIVIAADCNPRPLTKHIVQGMASSRGVPLIFVKDNKAASLRLGQLVKIKTAIAIGVKAKGNAINQLIGKILLGNDIQPGSDSQNFHMDRSVSSEREAR